MENLNNHKVGNRKGGQEKVQLLIKSDEEGSDSDTDLSSDLKKVKTYKVVRLNHKELVENNTFPCNTIIDSGTEWTVIGDSTWSIHQRYEKSSNMTDVENSINGSSMQCCIAVTAMLNGDGQVQLIRVKKWVYLPSLTDDETVVNSHLDREAG
eukprot:6648457-Ditylum_brightwellii.AAC.2